MLKIFFILLSFLQINCTDQFLADATVLVNALEKNISVEDILNTYQIVSTLELKYEDTVCPDEVDVLMRQGVSKVKDIIFYAYLSEENPHIDSIPVIIEQINTEIVAIFNEIAVILQLNVD